MEYQYARTYEEKKALGRTRKGDQWCVDMFDTGINWFDFTPDSRCELCAFDIRRPINSPQNQPNAIDQTAHIETESVASKLTRLDVLNRREHDWSFILPLCIVSFTVGVIFFWLIYCISVL